MLDYIVFLSCLEFAVLNSAYHDINFKPKQVICLEGIFLQNDVLCVLLTNSDYCKGSEFRKDYRKLGGLCAMFPDSPVIAMTATASYTDMNIIQESLGLSL